MKIKKKEVKGLGSMQSDTDNQRDWLFFGGSPSLEDTRNGFAFSDKVGDILRDILTEVKISSYHLDNIYPYYTKASVIKKQDLDIPRLNQIIDTIQPDYIVALGATALKALMAKPKAIKEMRDKGYVVDNYNRVGVFTFLPNAILSQDLSYREAIKDDLNLAKLYTDKVPDKLINLKESEIVIDLEWNQDLSQVERGVKIGKDCYYSSLSATKPSPADYILIGHNFKSDIKTAHLQSISDATIVQPTQTLIDTQVLANVCEEYLLSYSMAALSRRYFYVNPDKSGRNNLFDLPFSKRKAYNEKDLTFTAGLYNLLYTKLSLPEREYVHRQGQLLKALAQIERKGIRTDTHKFSEIEQGYASKLSSLHNKFLFNPDSPIQVSKHFKLPNSQADTLRESLQKAPNQEISDLLEYKKYRHFKSVYIDGYKPLIDPNTGYIHPEYSLTRTPSGRLATMRPNIQQIPRETTLIPSNLNPKAFIVPNLSDVCLMQGDVKQAELIMAANLSGDPEMLRELRTGDMHQATADIAGATRSEGKTANFAMLYLGGVGALIKAGIPKNKANVLLKGHKLKYRVFWQYMREAEERLVKDGYLELLCGRRRHWQRWLDSKSREGQGYIRSCLNSLFQNPVAELIKELITYFYEKDNTLVYYTLHDNLVFSIKHSSYQINIVNSTCRHTSEILNSWGANLTLPIEFEWSHGHNALVETEYKP